MFFIAALHVSRDRQNPRTQPSTALPREREERHKEEDEESKQVNIESEISERLRVSKFAPGSDPFGVNEMVTMQDLLDARVHFGHKQGMWNREMKPYLYGLRNGIHIINLNTTLLNLRRALNITGHIAYQYGVILFVNERPQFEALTMQSALKCKEYFATNWKPGIISNSFKLLKTLRVPDLMLFLSVPRSKTAVKESLTCGIPSVGVVDSDCNPNTILYPIPGNDDSPHSVRLYSNLFCEVILRGKDLRAKHEKEMREELLTQAEGKKQLQANRAAALDRELKSIYYGKGQGQRDE
jgi:small subunit ribosomal protein S2